MIRSIQEKIASQIAENLYPGASLALYRAGRWSEYYMGESQTGIATQEGLVYDLASVSKVVGVGTLLLELVRAGELSLDEPFQAYYPLFEDDTVSVRQLVTHTSGIDPFIPNRESLDEEGLRQAIHQIRVTDDKRFRYTDINLILLGFLLEKWYHADLASICQERIWHPWKMKATAFGPVACAVPTVKGVPAGVVHDPKARVLGRHCGSAGVFSTLGDLRQFVDCYLQKGLAKHLTVNLSVDKPRSLVWDLDGNWLEHTGYTGPFLMVNGVEQKAAIFLTNRTYHSDDRSLWIAKRGELLEVIKGNL